MKHFVLTFHGQDGCRVYNKYKSYHRGRKTSTEESIIGLKKQPSSPKFFRCLIFEVRLDGPLQE